MMFYLRANQRVVVWENTEGLLIIILAERVARADNGITGL